MVDNKNIRYVILVWGLVILSLIIPSVAATPPQTGHPYMLFHDISETPGYQYRTVDPWKTYQNDIIGSAKESLTRNFSGTISGYDRVMYRGSFAQNLGMAYQITKNAIYAEKAKEALLNLNVGTVSDKVDKAGALQAYSLAYDFIQPTLDPTTDRIIRDKLATLADTVYKDLNDNGTSKGYVTFDDYHGQAYPAMGVASAALYDYTNPNKLPLTSMPAEWHKVGTEYLFVNDKLHTYNRSLFSFGFDESSGASVNGAYKEYTLRNFATWFQVSQHAYGENLLELYPAAKKAYTSEVWGSLPNQYSSNYVTDGNLKWIYHKAIISLLPDTEKPMVLNHLNRVSSTLLPYSEYTGGMSSNLLYCVYGNYASMTPTFPANTSHLDPNSIFQVFRGNWNDDSDWLSLITFNIKTNSNRDMAHHDQLSFEYYSRGDLLLADAGENKYVLGRDYGQYEIDHNTIAIENPRTPFTVSSWSGSASKGIYKGYATGMVTPVTVDTTVQVPWMQLMKTSAPVTQVLNGSWSVSQKLSTPIQYSRTILYPDSDYFIVVDRMEGSEPWIYRNIFRPTSLIITPTVDANKDGSYTESEVGHVNGALTIGSTSYDWQALPYKTETTTGITANSLTWSTTNPYGKAVTLNLVSAPSSEILVEKNVGRIAGDNAMNEVFNPIIWFRTPATTSEYRVTALLSSYSTERDKNATEIAVTGTGHALKVISPSSEDYIYTGKGISSFAGFTTDADIVYIRKRGEDAQVTLLGGSVLKYQNDSWITLSKIAASITIYRENGSTDYRIRGEPDLQGNIFQQPVDSNMIERRTSSEIQPIKNDITSEIHTASEDTSDMTAFLEKLVKGILSIFTSK